MLNLPTKKRTGIANKGIAKARKERLTKEAAERQAVYATLTNVEKLAILDVKFGAGQGAAKQRKKLAQ